MSFLKPKTIEELILEALRNGPMKTTLLLAEIDPHIGGITKQGFYAALRKLKREETVVIYKSMVALTMAWIRQMRERLDLMSAAYIPSRESADLLSLGEKESISLTFSTTKHLDTFWGHSQSLLVDRTPTSEPVYSYDPHYWFYIARQETERKLVEDIVTGGRQFLLIAGGSEFLDKAIAGDFRDDLRQYHMEALFADRTYYVVVIGDYITEVHLDPGVTEQIERIYYAQDTDDVSVRKNLERLLSIKAKHRLRITRSARKARALKIKMGKPFFIRKP
ncbi:MAG: hypothetical protein JWL82_629 [Parcubacteria group bacterium]|nr:hypothetical protein [Parcubacteria group bacterium]